jgi:hypothetical protein
MTNIMKTSQFFKDNLKNGILFILFFCIIQICYLQTIYLDSQAGSDKNQGSKEKPLKTLVAGIETANHYSGNSSLIIKMEPGLYALDTNLTIYYNPSFNKQNRLIIEACVLPGDSLWKPENMPVIISTSLPQDFGGEPCTYTFNIESSHVTVRGIKFLGNPSMTTRHFCIYRTGDTLTDLRVSQCMFLGDGNALPVQVGVIAKGHDTQVEHCVFSNCRWAGIFFYAENWSVPIKNSSMHHCIISECYGGAIWTSLVGSDFKFYNNVVDNSGYFWIRNYFSDATFTIENCVISNVQVYNGEWKKDNSLESCDNYFVEKNVIKEGRIVLVELDKRFQGTVNRNFLHVAKGTPGYELHAGIFTE